MADPQSTISATPAKRLPSGWPRVKAQIDLALAQAEHARAQRALTLVTALEAVIEHDGKATASALVAQTLRRREGR